MICKAGECGETVIGVSASNQKSKSASTPTAAPVVFIVDDDISVRESVTDCLRSLDSKPVPFLRRTVLQRLDNRTGSRLSPHSRVLYRARGQLANSATLHSECPLSVSVRLVSIL